MSVQITLLALLSLFTTVLPFTLDIYHTNDIHARYDERGPSEGGKCQPDQSQGHCYGGMPRHAYYLKNNVDPSANNLILSGGDWFTGTTYFTVYTGNLTAHYLDELNYDAWALGNHEFDRGPELLAEVVRKIKKTKTLVANMEIGGDSGLEVEKSTIKSFTKDDGTVVQVGIIGYITPETSFLSSPGRDITFSDAVDAVKSEAAALKAKGVDIIVAVGHAGIETDLDICDQVDDVDVVVGGHTNTFLYTGELPVGPIIEEPRYGMYPLQRRGGDCLVVQAYAYGKFIGHLKVTFTTEGNVDHFSGNPVPMWGDDMKEDNDTLAELEKYKEKVQEFAKQVVGTSDQVVDGTRENCRTKECELGNVITDAFLDSFRKNDKNVVCCFINSGSIRASIPKGNITFEDVLTILPFCNTVNKAAVPGSMLKSVFEHSVSTFNSRGINVGGQGRYLQVSGIRVYYNVSNPLGSKVERLLIQNPDGTKYEEVKDEKEYQCVGASYILSGGDGFTQLHDLKKEDGEPDVDVFKAFLAKHNPLSDYPAIKNIPSRSFFTTSSAVPISASFILTFLVVLLRLLS